MRGQLIAVEGIDGAGTTTQCRRLAAWIAARGRSALLTREPSTGPIGALLREVLRGEQRLDAGAAALLFAADRLDHYAREIAPALADGAIVISDRYLMSSFAYQSLELPRQFLAAINDRAPPPDVTVFVDVTVEIAAERRRQRGGVDELYDPIETQRRVADNYRREAIRASSEGQRVIVVDGAPDPSLVFQTISDALSEICFGPDDPRR